MDALLIASARTAGEIISNSTFDVPPYQREYSWGLEEVREFFEDIKENLENDSYFLGLIILTDEGKRKKIVDGQQRIVTLTLLAATLYHEARTRGRVALSETIKNDFLTAINYDNDNSDPRIVLTDSDDNNTLQEIIRTGSIPPFFKFGSDDANGISSVISRSYNTISKMLRVDLENDPFRRLGKWADFIKNKLYFAVFIHPDPSSAYQVFEVINTRGAYLTTADLLKNFVISQSPKKDRDNIYRRWKMVSDEFSSDGGSSFVQYIRHVVTTTSGHILPKDLFAFLAERGEFKFDRKGEGIHRSPPKAQELLSIMENRLPLYLQIMDPTSVGPADETALSVFRAINRLNIITIRPLMMAICDSQRATEGLLNLLKIVTRRIVVGNLGTGNIERKFAEAAKNVQDTLNWEKALDELRLELDVDKESFVNKLQSRSFNRSVMEFLRNSIVQGSIAPSSYHPMRYIMPKSAISGALHESDSLSGVIGTIGNTILVKEDNVASVFHGWKQGQWNTVKEEVFDQGVHDDMTNEICSYTAWDSVSIQKIGSILAEKATEIWYA